MTAVISTTYDNKYLYFLPICVWAWNRLGVDVICFMPHLDADYDNNKKFDLLMKVKREQGLNFYCHEFIAPKHKESTYAQCSRLYAACLDLPEDDIIVMGDIDLIPFKIPPYANDRFTILGADLVPDKQLPMCFVSAPVKLWREDFCKNRTYQQCLDDLVGVIECEHFRGNQWCLDQSELYNGISKSNNQRTLIPRARPNTQFANHRVDRDDINWRSYVNEDLIDAHLWRDGFTDANFANIMELLKMKFPNESFDWLVDYTNEYRKLVG